VLNRFIDVLRRSAFFHALVIFLASGWVVLQILDTFIDNGLLPDWTFKSAVVLLLLGLPIVLTTAFMQGRAAPGEDGGAVPRGDDAARDDGTVMPAAGSLAPGRPAAAHRFFTWRNAIMGGVGAFALLGLGSGGWMGMRVLGIGPAGTLAAQGVIVRGAEVVLADFESGEDAELGDVVTRTLRIDLMQSRMIRVLDRIEINAPLARMEVEAGARVTNDVAAQLAEREGYAAVITGEVARAGSGYVLTASIRAGNGFLPVAGFRETARNDDELIGAIERLSRKIRDKAGESLRTVQGGRSLEQVTTSSLAALREYTRGEALQASGDVEGSLKHFERAVALDSTFAMAHRKIAVVLTNMQVRRADAVQAFRRAYELRDRLPDVERELASGVYHSNVIGDVAASASAYERAVAIDSVNIVALNNLGMIYRVLGRLEDAERAYESAIRIRPYANGYANLAIVRFQQGDLSRALATADSGMAALPAFSQGDGLKALFALARLDLVAADSFSRVFAPTATGTRDRRLSAEVRIWHAALGGKVRAAERVIDEADYADPITRASMRATLELMRGDTAAAVARVQRTLAEHEADDGMYYQALYALTLAGAADAADATLAAWKAAVPDDQLGYAGRGSRELATAGTLRARRDYDGALRTLETIRQRWPGSALYTNYDLAQTYDEMGNAALAIEWYERSLDTFNESAMDVTPQVTRALRRLGELHDAQGNTAKAIEYYARFTELWKDADPELQPQVRRAQQRIEALLPDRSSR
jgi:eukaryotic-like serine/threonine-protein kinase